jgi:hypothetical protein
MAKPPKGEGPSGVIADAKLAVAVHPAYLCASKGCLSRVMAAQDWRVALAACLEVGYFCVMLANVDRSALVAQSQHTFSLGDFAKEGKREGTRCPLKRAMIRLGLAGIDTAWSSGPHPVRGLGPFVEIVSTFLRLRNLAPCAPTHLTGLCRIAAP